MKNIIIQAGGLGTRLFGNTKNKPKCLVPVNGKPIIQYILEMYPDSNFYIISDYKFEILKKYTELFYSKYNINLIQTHEKGTCAGIAQAAQKIDNNESVLLLWSDLIIDEKIQNTNSDIVVYKTNSVTCRYCIKNKKIIKEISPTDGVVGVFCFKDKSIIKNVQSSGSFVGTWLQNTNFNIEFLDLYNIKEIGTLELLEKNSNKFFCRYFNNIEIKDNKIIKKCINKDFNNLINDEINWYKYVIQKKYKNIPEIYDYEPLTLQYIKSYQCHKFTYTNKQKENILKNISLMMKQLHDLDKKETNKKDIKEVYLNKTFERINKISDLIPFFNFENLYINNKKLQNPFFEKNLKLFKKTIEEITCSEFNIIHGDPTFSNILIKDNLETIFIDPRGSFGGTKIFGDKDYDYSKLYYSLVGNYDSINSKNYEIIIDNNNIQYTLKSNGWEDLEELFYKLFPIDKSKNILLNTIIWFSLCGYVVEDYDAILLAFCIGVEYWNNYLQIYHR